jgi:hypothetical protein
VLLEENLRLFNLMAVQVYRTRDALLHDIDDRFGIDVMSRRDTCDKTADCKEEEGGIDMHAHPLSNGINTEVAVHVSAIHECIRFLELHQRVVYNLQLRLSHAAVWDGDANVIVEWTQCICRQGKRQRTS